MKEYEQIFLTRHCKHCSEQEDKFGRVYAAERKFVSHVNDPNRFVCSTCGIFTNLTNKEIKDIQLNAKAGGIS